MIHRVQIFDKEMDIDICLTYITDTFDLFCLVYQDKQYFLFMIDLNASNIKEVDVEKINLQTSYSIGDPLLIYSENNVNKLPIKNMHIRGSSRNDPFDIGNKCVCLF